MNTHSHLTSYICMALVVSILTLKFILSIMEGRQNSQAMLAGDDVQKVHGVLQLLAKSDL